MMMEKQPPITRQEELLVECFQLVLQELQEIKVLLSKQEEKPKRKAVKKNETDSTRQESQ
jgi:hypothetical protein